MLETASALPWPLVDKTRPRASIAYNGVYVELETKALLKAG